MLLSNAANKAYDTGLSSRLTRSNRMTVNVRAAMMIAVAWGGLRGGVNMTVMAASVNQGFRAFLRQARGRARS